MLINYRDSFCGGLVSACLFELAPTSADTFYCACIEPERTKPGRAELARESRICGIAEYHGPRQVFPRTASRRRARLYAIFSLSGGIKLYPQAIAECVEHLGITDNFTPSLRSAYAGCLLIEGRRKVEVMKMSIQTPCDLNGLHKPQLEDPSRATRDLISGLDTDAWTRKLRSLLREIPRDVEDEEAQGQAWVLLQGLPTLCFTAVRSVAGDGKKFEEAVILRYDSHEAEVSRR